MYHILHPYIDKYCILVINIPVCAKSPLKAVIDLRNNLDHGHDHPQANSYQYKGPNA